MLEELKVCKICAISKNICDFPKSLFLYINMEDDNFKLCWALENLRPLSSKQNWKDGINRSRHGVINVL